MSVPVPADELEGALERLQPDLAYIFDDLLVHRDIQARVVLTGFPELRIFAKADAGDEGKGIRAYIKSALHIDPDASIEARSAAARLVLAWELAQKRVSTRNEHESQQLAADGPVSMLRDDYIGYIKAFTQKHSEIAERLQSSQSYLEYRLAQIKVNTYVAEKWETITSVLDEDDSSWGDVMVSKDGRLKMARGSCKGGMIPRNTEEFRQRYKLMGPSLGAGEA